MPSFRSQRLNLGKKNCWPIPFGILKLFWAPFVLWYITVCLWGAIGCLMWDPLAERIGTWEFGCNWDKLRMLNLTFFWICLSSINWRITLILNAVGVRQVGFGFRNYHLEFSNNIKSRDVDIFFSLIVLVKIHLWLSVPSSFSWASWWFPEFALRHQGKPFFTEHVP